jgi:PAS domain S-box-containing protein
MEVFIQTGAWGSLPMIENPGHKILFIDDDPSVRRLFERYSSNLNYCFVCADDGQEGLALAAALAPDIVITDLYMPGVDGFRVLESLSETHPDTPVVVLSGAGDLDAVIRALRLGAWDYLRKPLEKMELLDNTLAKALERSRLVKENRRYRVDLEKMVAHKTAEIQTSELRFQTMADFAYDWECWLSPAGEVIYSSPSCQRITGYSAAEFQAHPELIVEIVHVEDRPMVAEHTSRMALPEETCQLEFRIVTRSGETRWICHNCRPVHDARGNFQGRRMSNRDITQRKRFEGDLEQQKMELMAKSKHLEMANQALKAMLDHREIEHRSIEASILANLKRHVFPYTEQLAEMNLAPKARTYLQIIKTNIEELITPMNPSLSTAYQTLTPIETAVADLIRLGKSTKEIANLQNTSPRTVAIHRNKIRKKFGLVNSKTNLQTYLQSLS